MLVQYLDIPGAERFLKMSSRFACSSAALIFVFDGSHTVFISRIRVHVLSSSVLRFIYSDQRIITGSFGGSFDRVDLEWEKIQLSTINWK